MLDSTDEEYHGSCTLPEKKKLNNVVQEQLESVRKQLEEYANEKRKRDREITGTTAEFSVSPVTGNSPKPETQCVKITDPVTQASVQNVVPVPFSKITPVTSQPSQYTDTRKTSASPTLPTNFANTKHTKNLDNMISSWLQEIETEKPTPVFVQTELDKLDPEFTQTVLTMCQKLVQARHNIVSATSDLKVIHQTVVIQQRHLERIQGALNDL